MAEKLGALLINKGFITPKQLDEVLKVQMIYGGRTGSILVELGLLDIDHLGELLSEQRHYPAATSADFGQVSRQALSAISADVAQKHQAFPLAQDGRRLKVAMVSPYDPLLYDSLGFSTGFRIIASIVPELRFLYQLERHYGVPRDGRYIRMPPEQVKLPPGVRTERRTFAAREEPLAAPMQAEVPKHVVFGSLEDGEFLSEDVAQDPGAPRGNGSAQALPAAQQPGSWAPSAASPSPNPWAQAAAVALQPSTGAAPPNPWAQPPPPSASAPPGPAMPAEWAPSAAAPGAPGGSSAVEQAAVVEPGTAWDAPLPRPQTPVSNSASWVASIPPAPRAMPPTVPVPAGEQTAWDASPDFEPVVTGIPLEVAAETPRGAGPSDARGSSAAAPSPVTPPGAAEDSWEFAALDGGASWPTAPPAAPERPQTLDVNRFWAATAPNAMAARIPAGSVGQGTAKPIEAPPAGPAWGPAGWSPGSAFAPAPHAEITIIEEPVEPLPPPPSSTRALDAVSVTVIGPDEPDAEVERPEPSTVVEIIPAEAFPPEAPVPIATTIAVLDPATPDEAPEEAAAAQTKSVAAADEAPRAEGATIAPAPQARASSDALPSLGAAVANAPSTSAAVAAPAPEAPPVADVPASSASIAAPAPEPAAVADAPVPSPSTAAAAPESPAVAAPSTSTTAPAPESPGADAAAKSPAPSPESSSPAEGSSSAALSSETKRAAESNPGAEPAPRSAVKAADEVPSSPQTVAAAAAEPLSRAAEPPIAPASEPLGPAPEASPPQSTTALSLADLAAPSASVYARFSDGAATAEVNEPQPAAPVRPREISLDELPAGSEGEIQLADAWEFIGSAASAQPDWTERSIDLDAEAPSAAPAVTPNWEFGTWQPPPPADPASTSRDWGASVSAAPPGAVALTETLEALSSASSEGGLGKTLLAFCAGRFPRAYLFAERFGLAMVGRAIGAGTDSPAVSALRVDLEEPCCLSAAAQQPALLVRSAPEGTLDAAIFGALAESGQGLVVAALRLRQQPIAFLVICAARPLLDAELDELGRAAAGAEAAFARLRG